MKTYTLTVTEADLDAAIARREGQDYTLAHDCVIAQALQRQGDTDWVAHSFYIGDGVFRLDGPLTAIANAFDDREFDKARSLLPYSTTLTSAS